MARAERGAGQLIESVAFDELDSVPDGYGNRQEAFVERVRVRAGFTWLRGGESVQASRLEGQQPAIVRIRACDDTLKIRPDWRMRDLRGGTVYAIRGITRSDDRGFLDVLVQSGVAQ
jgi:head-tail adaptor